MWALALDVIWPDWINNDSRHNYEVIGSFNSENQYKDGKAPHDKLHETLVNSFVHLAHMMHDRLFVTEEKSQSEP